MAITTNIPKSIQRPKSLTQNGMAAATVFDTAWKNPTIKTPLVVLLYNQV
jgi:hypothetical protein